MMEEDPLTNVLKQFKKKQSLEESRDMIIKMELAYYKMMKSNTV